MISADFYPTTYNDTSCGYERTNTIASLGDGFGAYWLGWMYYDNIPQSMKVSEISFSDTRITATVINTSQNSPVGYVTDSYSYVSDYTGHIKEIPFTVSSNQSSYTCYLNGINCKATAREINESSGQMSSTYFMIMRETGTDESLGTYLAPLDESFGNRNGLNTLTDVIDFLNGDKTATITTTINGETVTIEINATELNDNYYIEKLGNANGTFYRICVFIAGYGTRQNYAYSSESLTGSNAFRNISTLKLFTENGAYYVNKNCGCYYTDFTFNSNLSSASASNNNKIDGIGFLNGFEFSITKGELNALVRYAFTFNGNTCFTWDRNYYFMRMYTPLEILHHLALNIRLQENNNPTYGYHVGIYCPEVLDDGEFTGNLLTGELTEDDVQPWQWDNINDSNFTEDDIPEYVPPSPEPDEDEESGTRIPNQFRYFTGANNFISQYAMKASQIQTFGQMLWNSWAESTTFVDAVNNFWIALNIENFTGSFDISSVMNFIVSLKVFPFNITHFDVNTFILTDTLRIGRGTFPFLFPSQVGNIIKVLSNIVYVDCGLIHDPTTGQYGIPRKFNDFRDYTNVSITCFCPYCGTVELNPGDVVGRQLSCKYAVDLQTGECLCLITVADSTGDLYNVAAISGNMGANIPVSATNSGLIEARRLSDAGNALGLFGGMFTENLSMGSNTFAKAKDSQSSIGAIASASTQAASNLFKDIKQTSNFAANMLSRGAIGCPMMQGGSGFAAFSQADTPYVQIRYGIYSEPANYSHSVGRISTKSGTLSDYKDSGLVICENVDVSGFTCHEDERTEIKALLESGVYL